MSEFELLPYKSFRLMEDTKQIIKFVIEMSVEYTLNASF